jgi:hypothetical protein
MLHCLAKTSSPGAAEERPGVDFTPISGTTGERLPERAERTLKQHALAVHNYHEAQARFATTAAELLNAPAGTRYGRTDQTVLL